MKMSKEALVRKAKAQGMTPAEHAKMQKYGKGRMMKAAEAGRKK